MLKNREQWSPSKFVFRGGRLRASANSTEVGVGSRLNADLVAGLYGEFLRVHARGRLLDLGCGKVPLYEAYERFVSENICVDWSNSGHDSKYIDIACDLSDRLPFEDGEFDTIILSDVLEHIATPDALWHEMARVLRSDGRLLMNAPFFYWLHEQPHDYYRYTKFALRRFVSNANLDLLELREVGGLPEVLADLAAKAVVRLPIAGKLLAGSIQSLTGWFVKTSIGGRASASSADNFPLGYFLVARKP